MLARCAEMALAGLHREYPNHVALVMTSDDDARPPRELTPVFYGCFDWHSAVHSHWTLVRLLRLGLASAHAGRAREGLDTGFTASRVAREVEYIGAPHRGGFERPYGLAWLLQLCAELREWEREGDGTARRWRETLEPLERLVARRLAAWLPPLIAPIRTGEHSQTAFALGLVLDYAHATSDADFLALARDRARDFFANDVAAPIAYEPSGYDFVSPALAEADVMRRVLHGTRFVEWFDRFLPDADSHALGRWLTPVRSPDPSDGKLSHLDGLNLSRAWMLEGITSSLPDGHAAHGRLVTAARQHAAAGLASLNGDHYAGTHWLGSFATYLLTQRGLPVGGAA